MANKKNTHIKMLILSLALIVIFLSVEVVSVPVGPTITYVKNETSPNAGLATARSGDRGGYITTVNLNAAQQNYAWKAYVGNVTGIMVLENALNYSIYEWPVSLGSSQEVYISRNNSVIWASVSCSNRSIIQAEDTFLSLNSSQSNSINRTFNVSTHRSFSVGAVPISNSTCPAISTFLNDAAQSSGEANKFQEVLLKDSTSNLIYASLVDQDQAGFDNSLYDFQAIVGENEVSGIPTTYYFYVELG